MNRFCTIVVPSVMLLATARPALAQVDAKRQLGQLVTDGQAFQKRLQFQEALNAYARAEKLAAQLFGPTHRYVATMAMSQGAVYREWKQPEKAIEALERGLKLAQAGKERALEAEAVNNLAAAYVDAGDYRQALAMHERGFALLGAHYGQNSPQAAVSRMNRADVLLALGQYAQAEEQMKQAIAVLEANRRTHQAELADALMNLANLCLSQGELPRAEKLLLRSVELKKQKFGSNHYQVALTQNNLAELYRMLGQYDKAEAYHLSSLRILEATLGKEHAELARSWSNLARIYQQQAKYAEAEPLYLRALALRERRLGKDHPQVAGTLHNLGDFYVIRGDYEQAEAAYLRALEIREKSLGADSTEVGAVLVALARLRFYAQQRPAEGRQLAERALQIYEACLPAGHQAIAEVNSLLGWFAAAEELWDEADTRFDLNRRAVRQYIERVLPALPEEDQLTFLRENDEAYYHSALSLIVKQPADERLAELTADWVLNAKGIAQNTVAQRALLARDTANTALAALAKNLLEVRKRLAAMFFSGGKNGQDSARRRQFDVLSQQEQETSERLAREGGRSNAAGGWTELDAVRRAIPADAVLVEICRFRVHDFAQPKWKKEERERLPARYAAWIIPAAGQGPVQMIDLGDATVLGAAVRDARRALEAAPAQILETGEPDAEAALRPVMRTLAQQVLDPLLPVIGDRRRIFLSPDAELWLVPWGALPLEGGEYAVERYDFHYVVSGRELVTSDTAFNTQPPVMFADPNYDLQPAEVEKSTKAIFPQSRTTVGTLRAAPSGASTLGVAPRLPGTKDEAEKVLPKLAAYAGSQPQLYTDRWALEAVFKAVHQPRVIVLSTHGFFQPDESDSLAAPSSGARAAPGNPLLRCGLLLAGCNKPVDVSLGDGEDGILTGLEIVSTDLRGTELVVLSACETGLGEVRSGEGVAGLRQSFQLAGARSVISTLWQIPDRESARLMSDFFDNLASGGDKSPALRDAQLTQIEARRNRYGAAHPFFWAAFTLTGD
ncbi:MAG TPA: CHAT domain-containing tetratricopeptide repeat protein [Pirellulales bacterium]|nr:CHAT domain-containing tetratricopeptide repeat protein [Pirellulales bacterium]